MELPARIEGSENYFFAYIHSTPSTGDFSPVNIE